MSKSSRFVQDNVKEEKPMNNILQEMECNNKTDSTNSVKNPECKKEVNLQEIIQHLVKTKAIFKSQQRGDPELSEDEKQNIAQYIFNKSPTLFLSRFGRFMLKEHLMYFADLKSENYEISYHLNKLERFFDKTTRHIDIKNRRYEALKDLVTKGEYFSETEMMKRNPLLYEHLVGQYMSEDQKRIRDNIDTQNITLSGILLESVERKMMKDLKNIQKDAEDGSKEEFDESEEDSEDMYEHETEIEEDRIVAKEDLWGEECDGKKTFEIEGRSMSISDEEIKVLKQEFVTYMYQSFLNGKDADFDYSVVDDNETYDNIEERTHDEEEKYFDSESPENIPPDKSSNDIESEDELDKYMKSLKESDLESESTMDCLK